MRSIMGVHGSYKLGLLHPSLAVPQKMSEDEVEDGASGLAFDLLPSLPYGVGDFGFGLG